MRPVRLVVFLCVVLLLVLFYAYHHLSAPQTYLHIFHAGSLTVPFSELAKRFEEENPGVKVVCEPYGSMEAVKQITDLDRDADVVGVSDYTVIESLMFPNHADWYIIFARNEIVIAYTNQSRYCDEINSENWYQILARADVSFGRADPNVDPCGYRTLMVWKLAEEYYGDQTIYERLQSRSPQPTRPKESDLVALLELGQIDYAFFYSSMVSQHGLLSVDLPSQIDLGSPYYGALYSKANVTLASGKVKVGKPIMYAVTIPKNAPHRNLAIKFVELILSEVGQEILRNFGQSPLTLGITNRISAVPEELKPYLIELEV